MKLHNALLAGLALTLGSAMSAVAIQGDRAEEAAETAVVETQGTGAAAWSTDSVTSQILVLPRPL